MGPKLQRDSALVGGVLVMSLLSVFLIQNQVPEDSQLAQVSGASTTPTMTLTTTQTSLSWTSTDATSCVASDGWTGVKTTSGSEVLSPSISTNYTLTCSGVGGSVSQSATIVVSTTTPLVLKPTVKMNAYPSKVKPGGSSRLTWVTTGADTCIASKGWTGDQLTSGRIVVTLLETTKYTLICSGPGGSSSGTRVIFVEEEAQAEAALPSKQKTSTQSQNSNESNPSIIASLDQSPSLQGILAIRFEVTNTNIIDIYLFPKHSETPQFLGRAVKVGDTTWTYTWDTTQTPNGEFELYATAKNATEQADSNFIPVVISNVAKPIQTEHVVIKKEAIQKTINSLIKVHDVPRKVSGSESATVDSENEVYIKSVDTYLSEVRPVLMQKRTLGIALSEYREKLDDKISELRNALRRGDETKVTEIQDTIAEIKDQTIASLPNDPTTASTTAYINDVATGLETVVTKNEETLRKEVAAHLDSDFDGLTDLDEVDTYKTDPYLADTDGDSFIDGAEIQSAFDPLDSTSEIPLTYMSPQYSGDVRQDILSVQTVRTYVESASTDPTLPKRAIIKGTALPNSFVTLYIFSTPLVVAVKTDASGNWSYLLDKELEDGKHKIYAGLTDNTGKIVAKSAPFVFTKTAEAYVEFSSQEVVFSEESYDNELFVKNGLLLALVFIGVLVLLNLREKRKLTQLSEKPKVDIRYPFR